ncbi:MAG: M48 family metallopeptidase [Pseudomonadota bacterium]
MRFEPRTPDAGVNVSKTHPLAEAGTLVLGLAGLMAIATVAIVFSIELLIRFVPVDKEVEWLSGWAPLETTESDHPQAAAARELLHRLTTHWPETTYEFRLDISEDPSPNAMALPGGLIIVTSGLLDAMEAENALAFVLGHELGHFKNRDHIRQLGRIAALGLFLSAMNTSGGSGAVGYNVSDLTLRGFSRDQEHEADRFGLELVYREYGHLGDALQFFAELDEQSDDGIQWDSYLGTHPSPGDRIGELSQLAETSGWPLAGASLPWPPNELEPDLAER